MSRMSFMDVLQGEMKVAILRGRRVPATTTCDYGCSQPGEEKWHFFEGDYRRLPVHTTATTAGKRDSYHMYIRR